MYVLWFGFSVARIGEAPVLDLVVPYYMVAMQRFFVFLLFCIFLLDAFFNGISMRKMIFGVIAVVLLQNVGVNLGVQGSQRCAYQFFVWIVLAYPKRLELKKAIFAVLIAGGIVVIASIALSLVGMIPNNSSTSPYGFMRSSFGFADQEVGSMFVCSLIMSWVYCTSSSWNWSKATAALFFLFVVFVVTGSRVIVGIACVQVVMTWIMNQADRWHWVESVLEKIVFKLGVALVPVFALLCLILVPEISLGGVELFGTIDSLFGGELAMASELFEVDGYHLFAHAPSAYDSLDNSYLRIAMSCGLICFVCLMVLYFKFGRFLEKRRDGFMSLYVALLAVRLLMYPILLLPVYNVAIFAIGFYLAEGPGALALEKEGSPSSEPVAQTTLLPRA